MSVHLKRMVTIPRGVFDELDALEDIADDCDDNREDEMEVALRVRLVDVVTIELELPVVEEAREELLDLEAPLIPEPSKKAYAATAAMIRSTIARVIAIGATPLPS